MTPPRPCLRSLALPFSGPTVTPRKRRASVRSAPKRNLRRGGARHGTRALGSCRRRPRCAGGPGLCCWLGWLREAHSASSMPSPRARRTHERAGVSPRLAIGAVSGFPVHALVSRDDSGLRAHSGHRRRRPSPGAPASRRLSPPLRSPARLAHPLGLVRPPGRGRRQKAVVSTSIRRPARARDIGRRLLTGADAIPNRMARPPVQHAPCVLDRTGEEWSPLRSIRAEAPAARPPPHPSASSSGRGIRARQACLRSNMEKRGLALSSASSSFAAGLQLSGIGANAS